MRWSGLGSSNGLPKVRAREDESVPALFQSGYSQGSVPHAIRYSGPVGVRVSNNGASLQRSAVAAGLVRLWNLSPGLHPGLLSASPFDKLRAGSAGLNLERVVTTQTLKPDVFSIIYGPTKVVP